MGERVGQVSHRGQGQLCHHCDGRHRHSFLTSDAGESRTLGLESHMVLRTASDFDQPPPGMTAAQNLARNTGRQYVGYLPALESAWRVGNTVVQEITAHWSKYK